MKDRVEFTWALASLLIKMVEDGENPIVDFVKRSEEEQRRLFEMGLSKCDGVKKRSRHQSGMAADIYFVKDGKLVAPNYGWEFWHEYWEKFGGNPMIDWDCGHFEG